MTAVQTSDGASLSALHKTLVVVRYSESYYASGGVSAHLHALNTALSSLLHLTIYQLYLDPDHNVRVAVIEPDSQYEQIEVLNKAKTDSGRAGEQSLGTEGDSVFSSTEPFTRAPNLLQKVVSNFLEKLYFLLEKNAPSLWAQIRSLRRALCSPNCRWLSRCLPGVRAQIRLNDYIAECISQTIRSVHDDHPGKQILYIDHSPYQPLTPVRLKRAFEAGAMAAAVYHGGYEQADISLLMRIARRHWFGVITLNNCPRRLRSLVSPTSEQHSLLHNGVDIAFFDRTRVQPGCLRSRVGAGATSRLILVPARITYQKGQHDLLDALAVLSSDTLSQLVVVFAGQTNSRVYRRWLEKKIRMSSTLRSLTYHFVGNLDQTDLRDGYRDSDLVVLPSHSEGVPRVLIEAQAMGLRCVATDVGGVREAIVNERCVSLVSAKDVTQIAKAIQSQLEASALCAGEIEENRRLLESRSGLLALAKRHGKFYQSLCQSWSAGRTQGP